MKKIFLFFIILLINGCNKTKTVLICGDHVCINNAEAEQYFEDNLTLEVKIIDKKEDKEFDLVELNLKSNSDGKKKINILNKNETKEEVKILSNTEIEKKRAEIKERKKIKNRKIKDKKTSKQAKIKTIKKQKSQDNIIEPNKIVNKSDKGLIDICAILEKCNIDEISKYLVTQGKKKKFPDITIRENK